MTAWRLVSYGSDDGVRAGVVVDERVYDAVTLLEDVRYSSILAMLEDWAECGARLTSAVARGPWFAGRPLESCPLLAPLPRPGTIYCVGANYRNHVDAVARRFGMPLDCDPHEAGLTPWFFLKSPSCVASPGAEIALDSAFLDWEGELAVVIGRRASHLTLEEALSCVGGYMVANDLSARDRAQRDKVAATSPFRFDWIGQKNFDGACPLGPWIVPASDVPDPQGLRIRTWVNDALKQDSADDQMLFTVAEQISFLSSRITLHPGDVVLTGTPGGTGIEIGECLKKGDHVSIEIDGIGRLENRIV